MKPVTLIDRLLRARAWAKFRLACCIVSALSMALLTSDVRAAPPPKVPRGKTMAPSMAITRPIKFAPAEVALRELAPRLKELAATPVWLDERALREAGIPLDRKLTLDGQFPTLSAALDAILPPSGLDWLTTGGVLTVTSAEYADQALETVVYRLAQPANPKSYDELIEGLTQVDPKRWAENGGLGMWSDLAPDLIVVAQTRHVHAQIVAAWSKLLQPIPTSEFKNPKPILAGWAPIQRALPKPTGGKFQNKPLGEALAKISTDAKLPISLDNERLGPAGVAADKPVSLDLEGVPLGTLLACLLRPLELAIVPERQGLNVTTALEAEERLFKVQFPVGDLATRNTPEELTALITRTIEPPQWAGVGGPSKIEYAANNDMLVGECSFDVALRIERLLTAVRAARSP